MKDKSVSAETLVSQQLFLIFFSFAEAPWYPDYQQGIIIPTQDALISICKPTWAVWLSGWKMKSLLSHSSASGPCNIFCLIESKLDSALSSHPAYQVSLSFSQTIYCNLWKKTISRSCSTLKPRQSLSACRPAGKPCENLSKTLECW